MFFINEKLQNHLKTRDFVQSSMLKSKVKFQLIIDEASNFFFCANINCLFAKNKLSKGNRSADINLQKKEKICAKNCH